MLFMKNIAQCLMAVVVLSGYSAWGRHVAVDLRRPMTRRQATSLMAAALPPDDGMLRRVDLNAGMADVGDVDVGDELELTLFDDVKITLRLTDRSPSLLEGDVFLAEASGYDGVKNAVVLRTEEGLTVDIQDFLKDRVYKVISTPDGVTVQELEPTKGGACGHDTFDPPDESPIPDVASHDGGGRKGASLLAASGGTTYVDVLVAYDKNATRWANSNGGGINNFAQTAVAKMNTALANTGLNSYFQFRLAGVTTVNVAAKAVDDALYAARWQSSGWGGIASKRDEVGADIVTTLIYTGISSGTIGVGYSLRDTSSLTSFASSAYNACEIAFVSKGHTMTHECGHNMGAGHASAVDPNEISPGPQLYTYSSGYFFKGNDGVKYHTIMGYNYDGYGNHYAEAPFFSSPSHYYKSVKVGDSSHDNTRTLRNTYSYVAQWRTRKPDLKPYQPSKWSYPLVISDSSSTATTCTSSKFLDSDNLYVSWAVECVNEDVNSSFTVALYVDGSVRQTWSRSSLSDGYYWHKDGYNLGSLSVGTHTIKIVADNGKAIDETNESNNTYTRTITVTRTPGSCEDAAVPFTTSSTIATYNVSLVKEWLSSYYSSSSGAFFAQTSVASGRLYTIAMPKGSDFTVRCADSSASVSYGVDDNLRYCLIDARGMKSSVALATLAVHGAVGAKVTVYAVAADYMPLGNTCKPEALPASAAGGQFRYDVTRASRGGAYVFSLDAVSGMRYEMRISGGGVYAIDIYGEYELIDSSSGAGYNRVLFTCPKGGKVPIWAFADMTGQMSVTWLGVDGAKRFKLALDANGGTVPVAAMRAAYGDRVGTLPTPVLAGHVFDGWHTAREGGTRVTADTRMTVAADITLYAHWTALVAGSCEEAAVGFSMTDSIRTYNVTLAREWRADSASYGNGGVLCCSATVERGRFYTIAMPLESSFEVECDDDGAVVTYGEDDGLAYCLVDTHAMYGDSANVCLFISGKVGERATVHVVAGDYMPLGSFGKPEVLPADNAGKDISYKVSRNLRNHCYVFSLTPVADMIYELRVSGQRMTRIYPDGGGGEFNIIESSDGSDCLSDAITFSCSGGNPISLLVGADTTGPVEVEWIGRRDKSMVRLCFDGNGGEPYVKYAVAERGKPVGSLPDAERSGFVLDGWYTMRDGGTRVTENTVFNSGSEVTLYARWKSLVLGSSFWAAVPFTMTADVRSYDVALTRRWDNEDGRYFNEGRFWCCSTFRRGGLYTIALPQTGPIFNVYYYENGVSVSYGEDDMLVYALVDTRKMSEDSMTLYFEIEGDVGEHATVYAVAADYLPLGSYGKPEILPASTSNTDGYFYYQVPRSLRNGTYEFTVNAVPGAAYLLCVDGEAGADISYTCAEGVEIQVLDKTKYWNYAALEFTCPKGGEVRLTASADTSGQVTVGWEGLMDCEDCYDVAP